MLDRNEVLAAMPMRQLKGMIREAERSRNEAAVCRVPKMGFALGELLAERQRRARETTAPPLRPLRTAQTIREEAAAAHEQCRQEIAEEMRALPRGLPGVAYVGVGSEAVDRLRDTV